MNTDLEKAILSVGIKEAKAAIAKLEEEAKKPKISAEEWFRSFCFGLTNRHEPSRGNNVILYDKEIDGKVVTLFEQDWKNGYLWVSQAHIWSVLLTRYSMNDQQVREFVEAQVEEVLKWKGLTAERDPQAGRPLVEEALKWKGLTASGLM